MNSKRLKLSNCCNRSNRDNDIDRISDLSDELISYILSFLPTKCAVATSILSTRWKSLWTSIYNFDLTCPHHDHQVYSGPLYVVCKEDKIYNLVRKDGLSDEMLERRNRKSTLFVNRLLLLLNNPCLLQKFRLRSCHACFDPSSLNSWVSLRLCELELYHKTTVKHPLGLPFTDIYSNMEVLKLGGNLHYEIPPATFLCFPSLGALYLDCMTFAVPLDSSISFPNLKSLTLSSVGFASQESMLKLLSSSPVLDQLILKRYIAGKINCFTIRIPSLTRLSIGFDNVGFIMMSKLQIDCPKLQYLNLGDPFPWKHLHVDNLPSLLEANVQLLHRRDDNDYVNEESCTRVVKFIGSLTNAKLLSASGRLLKALRIAPLNIPSGFHNLTRLEIDVYNCRDLFVLINEFLGSMDNLQHLVIKGCQMCKSYCFSKPWWTEPLNVPRCLLSGVTSISYGCMIVGCCDQLELLKYFLKNAEVLQMLTIVTDNIPKVKQLELREEIPFMPRVSRKCQVVFSSSLQAIPK